MLRTALLALLGFALSSAALEKNSEKQPKACTDQNMVAMQNCYRTMMGYFNISAPPFPQYFDYIRTRGNYLLYNGAPAMIRVCNWEHELEQCLMNNVPMDCMNPMVYQTVMNANNTQLARDWYTDFYVMQYECGPGFRELLQNFYCFENVDQYHRPAIQHCVQGLINSTMSPNFQCMDLNMYIDCMVNVYVPECGEQSRHFVCSVERVALAVNVPNCESQLMMCDMMSSSMRPPMQQGVRVHGIHSLKAMRHSMMQARIRQRLAMHEAHKNH